MLKSYPGPAQSGSLNGHSSFSAHLESSPHLAFHNILFLWFLLKWLPSFIVAPCWHLSPSSSTVLFKPPGHHTSLWTFPSGSIKRFGRFFQLEPVATLFRCQNPSRYPSSLKRALTIPDQHGETIDSSLPRQCITYPSGWVREGVTEATVFPK